MDARALRPHVAPLFRRGRARTVRVAVEQELLAVDAGTGGAVDPGRVRAAAHDAGYAPFLGFEPGGQVELSLPCASGPAELVAGLLAADRALRSDCAAAGVRLVCAPVDRRPLDELPLQEATPRYLAMQDHFDTIGPAGRRMMRATASTQVCLDWWPGTAGAEQWRVLHLAAPFLAAAFARSAGPGSRLATWLAVDPGRTAFDDRLTHADDPVADYVELAAGAVMFVAGGVAEHLTTLFPPVRPRGRYLEVRFADVQEAAGVARLVATLTSLVYDDAVRRRALALLEPRRESLGERWHAAAIADAEVVGTGHVLVRLAGAPGAVAA